MWGGEGVERRWRTWGVCLCEGQDQHCVPDSCAVYRSPQARTLQHKQARFCLCPLPLAAANLLLSLLSNHILRSKTLPSHPRPQDCPVRCPQPTCTPGVAHRDASAASTKDSARLSVPCSFRRPDHRKDCRVTLSLKGQGPWAQWAAQCAVFDCSRLGCWRVSREYRESAACFVCRERSPGWEAAQPAEVGAPCVCAVCCPQPQCAFQPQCVTVCRSMSQHITHRSSSMARRTLYSSRSASCTSFRMSDWRGWGEGGRGGQGDHGGGQGVGVHARSCKKARWCVLCCGYVVESATSTARCKVKVKKHGLSKPDDACGGRVEWRCAVVAQGRFVAWHGIAGHDPLWL